MRESDLRKLKRSELLELMVAQSKEIDRLRARVSELEAELSDRRIAFDTVGSLAEASIAVTNVFNEAQKTADLYLHNIRRAAASAGIIVPPGSSGPWARQDLATPVTPAAPARVLTHIPSVDETDEFTVPEKPLVTRDSIATKKTQNGNSSSEPAAAGSSHNASSASATHAKRSASALSSRVTSLGAGSSRSRRRGLHFEEGAGGYDD